MEPNWAKVLVELYRHDTKSSFFDLRDSELDTRHPLVKKMDLNVREVRDSVRFLDRNGLIEEEGEGIYRLTPSGFEVARNHRMDQSSMTNGRRLGMFSFVLAISSIVQLLQIGGPLLTDVVIGVLALILLSFAIAPILGVEQYLWHSPQ